MYAYEAPKFSNLLFGDSRVPITKDFVQQSQDILKALKDNIQQIQNQQKRYADQNRTECSFEVEDMVYLRLQTYRQSTLKRIETKKLQPRYC